MQSLSIMLSQRVTQMSVLLLLAAASVLLLRWTGSWFSAVGVAVVTGLAGFAGYRTVDRLSLLYPHVIGAFTAKIFPSVRSKVKSSNESVDTGTGYDLESELSELLICIVKHCIESWYYHISECQSPVDDAQLLISNVTKQLIKRISIIDRYRLLCKILYLYQQHLYCCGYGEARHLSPASPINHRNILSSTNTADVGTEHVTDSFALDSVRYLNTVVFLITSKLLDENSPSCVLGTEIVAQIIVKEVILKVIDIASRPEWLYNIVADILRDPTDKNFDTVTNNPCAELAADNNAVGFQGSCFNDVMDNCVSCELRGLQAVTGIRPVLSDAATAANSDTVSDEQQFSDLADAEPETCCNECVFVNANCNRSRLNSRSATDLASVEAEGCECAVPDRRCGRCLTDVSQDPNCLDSRHLKPDNDYSVTFRQNLQLESLANGGGYYERWHCDANTQPVLLPHYTGNHVADDLTQYPVSPSEKKKFSLGHLLPSLKTKHKKQQSLGVPSTPRIVFQVPRGSQGETEQESVAKTSCSTVRLPRSALIKMKSLGGSVEDLNAKPSIRHSASMNVLTMEARCDESANLVSQHLPRFIRRASLRSCVTSSLQSIEADSASDPELQSGSDVEVNATEADKVASLQRRPEFLMDSVHISDTERDIPVSKPYTVYIISVRIIQLF